MEMMAKDKVLEDEILHMRRTVQTFLNEETLEEAEVTPVTPPSSESSAAEAEGGASGEGGEAKS